LPAPFAAIIDTTRSSDAMNLDWNGASVATTSDLFDI
jgi:hypothetical protein